MNRSKHKNIAIFIPHLGCGHKCVFCDQKQISGTAWPPSDDEAEAVIKGAYEMLSDGDGAEIAFFGGSFTGIKRKYMLSLLTAANKYILSDGRIKGIRISTRPDLIDTEILDLLTEYKVTAIELGAQSMDDGVLDVVRRGHDADAVVKAAKLIKLRAVEFGLQMMTGLPEASFESDIKTALDFVKLRPDTVRIYPAIVVKGTELEDMYNSGAYLPLSVDEAVERCVALVKIFEEEDVKIIRMGLHADESLENGYVAGPYHPAFRELVEGAMMKEAAIGAFEKMPCDFELEEKNVTISVAPGYKSKMIGQKRCNAKFFIERYKIISFTVKEDDELDGRAVFISIL